MGISRMAAGARVSRKRTGSLQGTCKLIQFDGLGGRSIMCRQLHCALPSRRVTSALSQSERVAMHLLHLHSCWSLHSTKGATAWSSPGPRLGALALLRKHTDDKKNAPFCSLLRFRRYYLLSDHYVCRLVSGQRRESWRFYPVLGGGTATGSPCKSVRSNRPTAIRAGGGAKG